MSESQTVDDQMRQKPFSPTPTQTEFLQCTEKQILMSGSYGAGKTRVGCEKGYLMNLKYPGNRGLIVRNSFTDLRNSTVEQTLTEEVIPESHIETHNQTKHKIEHFTGTRGPHDEPILSEIHYHGLDQSSSDDIPTKIGGQQYGWIFVDEGIEIDRGAWIQLLGRLRYSGKEKSGKRYEVPFRQIFTATNPASKSHWMYQWFFGDEEADDKEIFRMTARELAKYVDDIPDDYVETMEKNFEGMFRERYLEGKWVIAEGLVYNEWNPDVHKKDASELPGDWGVEKRIDHGGYTSIHARPPDDWKIYRTVDFGYNNPFVCQWWARHPQKDLHVMFREIYQTEQLVQDLAERIKNLSENMRIEKTLADPAQAEDCATLNRHGVSTTKAVKDISAGVQEVKAKLNIEGDDGPGILFLRGALTHQPDSELDEAGKPTRTTDEFSEYQWDEENDKPEDGDDHGMDCTRYYTHSVSRGTTWTKDEMENLEEMFNDGEF